jgi:hypothetical protein
LASTPGVLGMWTLILIVLLLVAVVGCYSRLYRVTEQLGGLAKLLHLQFQELEEIRDTLQSRRERD